MKDKTIVLWSGGVDSTGALYKILKEYDDDVVAHHIHIKTDAVLMDGASLDILSLSLELMAL